jgi:hypothetical protein
MDIETTNGIDEDVEFFTEFREGSAHFNGLSPS